MQCTADLMPADVMGTNIFNMATSSFSLHRGPVFTDLLLVDEINRTSPRTQAALLEVDGRAPGHHRRDALSARRELSPSLQRKTRSSSKALIRFPKRNSTGSS